jgi:ubiquinone/menaquinone biosynthesis methyltransferase
MSQVDFGSKMIEKDAKQSAVNEIFSKIAANYDLMNDLMSMGVHRLWKDEFVSDMGDFHPNQPLHFLDMAGGTGDIAFRIMDKIQRENSTYTKIQSTVTVSDINADMLNEGKKRSKDRNFSNLDWVVANAEELPFADASFDFYTIVFGIRNVPDRLKALKEAHRVLKTGGRFMCMEFSKVILPGFDFIYSQYSKMVIPTLGQFIANDRESYVYLIESIERFPTQEEFASLINEAGFNHVNHRNLSFGICAIHSGVKI